MGWQDLLQDAGVLAGVSTVIFVVIDFIKRLYYKMPYKWVQDTPGEVWYGLSLLIGIGIAVAFNYNDFKSIFMGDTSALGKAGSVVSGLVLGTGSKVIHAVASPAAAKLQSFKLEHKAKSDALTGGTGYVAQGTGVDALSTISAPSIAETECATPVPNAEPEIKEKRKYTKKPTVILVKEGDDYKYVLVDGVEHLITEKVAKV